MARGLKIGTKVLIALTIVLVFGNFISSFLTVESLIKQGNEEIKSFEETEIAKSMTELKSYTEISFNSVNSLREKFSDQEKIKADVEEALSKRVNIAYNYATSTYQSRIEQGKSIELIQKEISAGIKGMNKDSGDNYYWINDIQEPYPTIIMHPSSSLIGKPFDILKGDDNFVAKVSKKAKINGEAFMYYNWKGTNKIAYTRHIKGLNWIIGSGMSLDILAGEVKENAKDIVKSMTYANSEGYFWVQNSNINNTEIIAHPMVTKASQITDSFKKNNIDHILLVDENLKKLVSEEEYADYDKSKIESNVLTGGAKLAKEKGSGYIYYLWKKPDSNVFVPKLSYIKYMPEWDWVIGTGIYLDHIQNEINSKKADIRQNIKNMIIKNSLIAIALVIINWLTIVIITNQLIARPLGKVVDMLKDISNGDGDLTMRLPADRKDEIGELEGYFNKFVSKLNFLISDIKKLVINVSSDCNNLNTSMDVIVKGNNSHNFSNAQRKTDEGVEHLKSHIGVVLDKVRNQTASIEESLASLQEISASGNQTAESVELISRSSKDAIDISNVGYQKVEDMNIGIQTVNQNVGEAEKQIDSLLVLSENIGQILTSINSIADQTNLLALNAAIEAARAGSGQKVSA